MPPLRQVIINLRGNALKFTERGEVTIAQAGSRGRERDTVAIHSVRYRDGYSAGEAEEDIRGVWPQADMSTTRKFGGTGLGLSISERLVKLMGGHIWLESGKAGGADFISQ